MSLKTRFDPGPLVDGDYTPEAFEPMFRFAFRAYGRLRESWGTCIQDHLTFHVRGGVLVGATWLSVALAGPSGFRWDNDRYCWLLGSPKL